MIKSVLLSLALFAISCEEVSETNCPNIDFKAINFSTDCTMLIDDEKVEDKFLIINSAQELQQHVKFSVNGCLLVKDQLDIDFSKYTLLIGKKKLYAVQGALISQSIKKDCYREKYIYQLSIKNGGYTALGNFVYGVIMEKIKPNAFVIPEISILD